MIKYYKKYYKKGVNTIHWDTGNCQEQDNINYLLIIYS